MKLPVFVMMALLLWIALYGAIIPAYRRSSRATSEGSALRAAECIETLLEQAAVTKDAVDSPVIVGNKGNTLIFTRFDKDSSCLRKCVVESRKRADGTLSLVIDGVALNRVRLSALCFQFDSADSDNDRVHFLKVSVTGCSDGDGGFTVDLLKALEQPTMLWRKYHED